MNTMRNLFFLLSLILISSSVNAQQATPNLPWVDLSAQTNRHVVIAEGTPELYNGHPTTVMLDDNKTIYCTWSYDHGGKVGFIAKSEDTGLTWQMLDTPADWPSTSNCPSIYNLQDKSGKERLMVFAAHPLMTQSYSEDLGETWTPVRSLGKPNVMAFSSIVQLDNGDHIGFYHRGHNDQDRAPLTLWQSRSTDGGLTWDESVCIAEVEGRSPCEPFVFYAPNQQRLICVARENNRMGNSLIMFSDDQGETWSEMKETPWGLSGDRHMIKYTPDGRLVSVFRDMAPNSPTKGHFVAWVGTYNDLMAGYSGQYKVKLLHSFAGWDCGYPGLEILPDGTIVATTYIKYRPGEEKHSIVSVRFKLDETDKMAAAAL